MISDRPSREDLEKAEEALIRALKHAQEVVAKFREGKAAASERKDAMARVEAAEAKHLRLQRREAEACVEEAAKALGVPRGIEWGRLLR